jgi:DNA-binding NarL/FixJ family response regulator
MTREFKLMSRRVLFVGGDKDAVLQVQTALHKEPYEIAHVKDETEAYTYLRDVKASVVVADENMPGGRGADFLTEVQKRHPTTVRIMVTGHGDRAGLIDAVNRAEIYRFVSHPFAPPALARVLRDALTIARVAEAQEAVWTAAKKQQEAMQKLLAPDGVGSIDEADGAVAAARFAGMSPEGEPELERIGELPEEHAQRLSTREREIVEALGSGRRVKDIAQDLVISTHTVRNHLKAIYRKLNVRSQFELISLMARHSKES